MQNKTMLVLLSLLLVAAAATWFFRNFERVTGEITTEASPEVRRNPFLAAERFLAASGREVESSRGRDLLQQLPSPADTLIINHLFESLSSEKAQALFDWIRAGGHLMLTPRTSWSEQGRSGYRLLDELGIHRHGVEVKRFGLAAVNDARDDTIVFRIPGIGEPLEAAFIDTLWLEMDEGLPDFGIPYRGKPHEQSATAAPKLRGDADDAREQRYHLIQRRLGKGLVTVTSDNLFMSNTSIGDLDHAWLLWLLTDRNGKVWLLYDKAMPSLWSLLVQHASPVVISFAILILLLLWYGTRRIGPLITAEESGRRDLIEHLDATSRYHWRNGNRDYIAADTRRQVIGFWQSQHSQLSHMSPDEQAEWIGRRSGLDAAEIRAALFCEAQNREEFVRQAQTLQLLRLRIHRG
jgi:hypothetical protein